MVPAAPAFPGQLEALRTAAAYPHPVQDVELVETYISWVLLTGEYAYKIKRPVHFEFLDFRELAARERFCREELRLNRRFAPGLYVDVVPVTAGPAGARVGGDGEIIDFAVKMRQFDRRECLDALLSRSEVEAAELRDFGRALANAHAACPVATRDSPWGRAGSILELLLRNGRQAAAASTATGTAPQVRMLCAELEALVSRLAPVLEERRRVGSVRECHGDLHARNIVRTGGRLLAFDCLEFEPAFRWIDLADELALLRVDLAWRGREDLAQAFTTGYLDTSGDYELCRVLRLYEAHRALVRAKVAALAAQAGTEDAEALAREHRALLDVAHRALRADGPRLVLVGGVSGSGKSWLAERLAAMLPAMWLRSDVERKRLAGLAPEMRSGSAPGAGLYTPEMSSRTYARLAECARAVLAGGYTVVVDATFLRATDRSRFVALARDCEVPLQMIQCEADTGRLRDRLAARAIAGDVSEADAAVLEAQLATREPVSPTEGLQVTRLDTGDAPALAALLQSLRESTPLSTP